jgi:hypothetical protein
MASMSLLLCEGYDDRAFWNGAVTRLGCRKLNDYLGGAPDAWGHTEKQRGKGVFSCVDPSGQRQFRIQPCAGDDGVLAAAEAYLARHSTNAIDTLVVVLDRDKRDGDVGRTLQAIRTKVPPDDATTATDGRWEAAGAKVHAIALGFDGEPCIGVPEQQCLERVVCAALAATYSTRAEHVAGWLERRPDKPSSWEHKAHAWSYMAGWFAEHGTNDFLQAVWRDEAIASQLLSVLAPTGALEALRELTGMDPLRPVGR